MNEDEVGDKYKQMLLLLKQLKNRSKDPTCGKFSHSLEI